MVKEKNAANKEKAQHGTDPFQAQKGTGTGVDSSRRHPRASGFRRARPWAVAGMLGAVSIVLGATPLGIIPIPPMGLTIMHIPVILGALLEGPLVGVLVGLIFGAFSLYQGLTSALPTGVIFIDPLVSILPRLFIGLAAWAVWRLAMGREGQNISRGRLSLAAALGAIAGTLTNTVGVLGMIYLRHLSTYAEVVGISQGAVGAALGSIALLQGLPEAAAAALICVPVVLALRRRKSA